MNQLPEIPQVEPVDAQAMIADGALLIDVREQDEWDESRIPDAVFRPMSQINEWWQDLPTDRAIVVQCVSGGRSQQVAAALVGQAGLTNIHNLAGGIVRWAKANLPLES